MAVTKYRGKQLRGRRFALEHDSRGVNLQTFFPAVSGTVCGDEKIHNEVNVVG